MNYHLIAQISFVLLSLVCLLVIHRGLSVGMKNFSTERRGTVLRKYWFGLTLWIIVVSIASLSGFTANFDSLPPRPLLFILIPMAVLIMLLRSATAMEILRALPHRFLIQIQVFRVPVEILLWLLLLAGVTPIQMTFEGRNLDILVGLTAPVIAYAAFAKGRWNKKLAIGWNIFGLMLLANILVIAVLSMPTPLRVFMNEPANTEVAKFPVVFLPAILVPIAYYFHVFSLKKLLMERERGCKN